MNTQILGQVGPSAAKAADGVNLFFRQGSTGEMIFQKLHGDYYEQAQRKNIRTVTMIGVTLAAANAITGANATATLAAGGTPIVGIINPINSGVNVAINRIKIATTSGTPAGAFYLVAIPISSTVTVSALATVKGINHATFLTDGVALCTPNIAITGSQAASVLRVIGGTAAVAAGAGLYCVDEETKGDIVLPPNTIIGIACKGAGTTHIIDASITYEEIAI